MKIQKFVVRAVWGALISLILLGQSPKASAFDDGAIRFGLGFYSQNVAGKITNTADGAPASMGATTYPFFVKYDLAFTSEWFFSPSLSYTPLGRASAGDSAQTTMLQVLLPVGTDFMRGPDWSWDWQSGVGIANYSTKGKGGTEVLSNGTGTATFARPGRSTTVQTVVFELGTALNYGWARYGVDLLFEGLLSSGKRSQSLMFSWSFRI